MLNLALTLLKCVSVCALVGGYLWLCVYRKQFFWVKLLMDGLNNWMDLARSLSENERNVNYPELTY